MVKLVNTIYFLVCFITLNAQGYICKFDKHLDSILRNYIVYDETRETPLLSDSILIDSIHIFIEESKNNPVKFNELSLAIQTFLLKWQTPYVLAKPIFIIYKDNFKGSNNYLPFILNFSFTYKFLGLSNNLGAIGGKAVFLYDELSTNCILNQQMKNEILKSNFLIEDYKKVRPESYKHFFRNCDNELSLDNMIHKSLSKKKKAALKEIKQMIY